MNRHEEMKEQLAAYALGALNEREAAAIRVHLKGCAECQAEFSSLVEVSSHLAEGIPRREPPLELRSRVIAGVEREAQPRGESEASMGRFKPTWLWAGAALVFFLVQAWLLNEILSLREANEEQQQILAVMLSTDMKPVELQFADPSSSADGSFRMEQELNLGVLNYYHLEQPEPGSYYQCWFGYTNGSAISCGELPLDADGHGLHLVEVPVPLPDTIRVTQEKGAVSTPSGMTILEAEVPREN